VFKLSVRKALIISGFVSIVLLGSLLFLLKRANDEFRQIYSVEFPLLQTVSASVRLMDQAESLLRVMTISDRPSADVIAEYLSVKEALVQSLEEVQIYIAQSRLKKMNNLASFKSVLDSDEKLIELVQKGRIQLARAEHSTVLLPKLDKFREEVSQVAYLISTQDEERLEENRLRFYYYSVTSLIGFIVAAFLWIHIFYMYRKSVADRAVAEKELEVQRARNVHSSKLSALGEMAGGVAHEINTPLATIRMTAENCEYLLSDGDMKKEVFEQSLSRIIKTVDRIAKIVLSLKTFSRDGSNDKFERVSCKKILDEVLSFSSERFKSNEVEIRTDIDDIEFYCQQIQIEQVLLNLLNNAFDAVQSVDKKWIKISAKAEGGMLRIVVMDSGEKIPPEVEQKLMSPFFTTKEIGKGTGLGLSVSLGIAKRHGGNLFYDNQTGNTAFVLLLPITSKETVAS
jgi:C4-dicarboxylate-specific signal transduction histidine kinase